MATDSTLIAIKHAMIRVDESPPIQERILRRDRKDKDAQGITSFTVI